MAPNQQPAAANALPPSVNVGLGGVGKEVVMRVRRMIVENYGKLSNLPVVQFLHVDTDIGLGWHGENQVLGEDISLVGHERIDLSQQLQDRVGVNTDLVRNSPEILEWLPKGLDITKTFHEGAGGVRACGRIAFQFSVDVFRERFNGAFSRALDPTTTQDFTRRTGVQVGNTVSVLLVIGAGNMSSTAQANCYGALKKLEYLAPRLWIGRSCLIRLPTQSRPNRG